jgi:hypothetical protein
VPQTIAPPQPAETSADEYRQPPLESRSHMLDIAFRARFEVRPSQYHAVVLPIARVALAERRHSLRQRLEQRQPRDAAVMRPNACLIGQPAGHGLELIRIVNVRPNKKDFANACWVHRSVLLWTVARGKPGLPGQILVDGVSRLFALSHGADNGGGA